MVKINLKTLVYNTIRQKIVACVYTPGIYLNKERLTEELKISRTPICDALSLNRIATLCFLYIEAVCYL